MDKAEDDVIDEFVTIERLERQRLLNEIARLRYQRARLLAYCQRLEQENVYFNLLANGGRFPVAAPGGTYCLRKEARR